jgi:hypothetical protein
MAHMLFTLLVDLFQRRLDVCLVIGMETEEEEERG